MAFGIKRGATLLLAVQFTAEEWARIAPVTEARAACRVAGDVYTLVTTINPTLRAFIMRSETTGWKTGTAEMDVTLIHGSRTAAIPELTNIRFPVAQGVSL